MGKLFRLCAALCILTAPASAAPLCTWLAMAIAAPATPPPAMDGAETCAASQGQAGPSQHCRFEFAYRDPSAIAAFSRLRGQVTECLKADGVASDTSRVNHPDSYATHVWTDRNARVTLALKDKAARGRSYIFLRVDTADD